MTPRLLDAMDDAAAWQALVPGGETASAAMAIAVDRTTFRMGDDRASLRVAVSPEASGHRVRRTREAVDLSSFDELRLWLRCTRAADGAPATPFLLELRLGSVARPVGSAGNTWVRRLPTRQKDQWELVRVSLEDLSPQVRAAATEIELRCLDVPAAYVFHMDALLAVRDEFLVDIEATLVGALHRRMKVADKDVSAAIADPDTTQPEPPCIRILPCEIRHYPALTPQAPLRSDFTADAFRLQPPPEAYGLTYELEPLAGTREDKLRILDFLLRTLTPRGELPVNGVPLPIEWKRQRWVREGAATTPERPRLRVEVRAWQHRGAAQPVRPIFGEVRIDAESR